MEHYCTLFDSGFLPQGLALHASLRRHAPDSTLWVLCMDQAAEDALRRMDLPGIEPLALSSVETPDVLAVKGDRTRGEYCWTLTSVLIAHLLQLHPDWQRVTYLDADLWFRDSPTRILDIQDATGAHALLTPHDYDPEHDQSERSGRYCVQFVPVRNTPEGMAIVRWWRDRCLEWCYARQEPGRFGDQMYLDRWIPLFGSAVHEIPDPSITLAPWNCRRHEGKASQAVLYHFHNLRIHEGWMCCLWRTYEVPAAILATFYRPYLDDLRSARERMVAAGVHPRLSAARSTRLPDRWRRLVRRISGTERWESI